VDNIQRLILEDVNEKDRKHKEKPRSGKFNPGLFGRCYRLQYYNRKDEVKSNPPDTKTLLTFRLGTMIHEDIQSLLPAEGVEVEVTKDDIHGFVDYVGKDYVVDFKSAGTWAFKKVTGAKYSPEENMVNLLQVVAYGVLLEKPWAFLTYISKDNYQMKTFEFKVDEWRDELEEELAILRGFWSQERLPPPSPRAYNGKECQYCNWVDTCEKEQQR
jgi:CRISPR/Cas system-associated exonuclease Cas4 (RecB family)